MIGKRIMLILQAKKDILSASRSESGFCVLEGTNSAIFNFELVERPFIKRGKPLSGLDNRYADCSEMVTGVVLLPTLDSLHKSTSHQREVT